MAFFSFLLFSISYFFCYSCVVLKTYFFHLSFLNLFSLFKSFNSFEKILFTVFCFFQRFLKVFIIKIQLFNLLLNIINHRFYLSFLLFHYFFIFITRFRYHSLKLSSRIIKYNPILTFLFPLLFIFFFFFNFDTIFNSAGRVVDAGI